MKLRTHLLVLTLAVLLPVSIFGVATTLWVADRERDAFEHGARQRTLALLTAVDTELNGHVTSLQALATSYDLQTGDLGAFYRQSKRLLPMHTHWRRLTLSLPSGERVLTVSRSPQTSPRAVDRAGIDRTLQTRAPTIGGLVVTDGDRSFPISVPVEINGEMFVLGVLVDARSILDLLTPQRLQRDWVAVVLDQNGEIVAGTYTQASVRGDDISRALERALEQSGEGWVHYSFGGEETYTPYNRSTRSGWTVAMAIPATDVDAVTGHTIVLLAVGLLLAVLIATLLAAGFSRRIADPMAELAAAAKALGRGTQPVPPTGTAVREVRDVSRALITSARAIGEREERLRAADRAKDEFLAMLGHELRNPLGALTSATQILNARVPGSQPPSDAVAIVSRQVEHMTRIVDDLLDVGRATSGKVRLKLAPLELGHVVTEVTKDLRRTSLFAKVAVELDVCPAWIQADQARIEQIASNLLENAAKYTAPGGSIRITVREENGEALLEVVDTGIGIPEDLLPRIFDLFVQGQRSIDRSVGGLGIGLTLVKRLAELHNGSITAVSGGRDQGARFVLRFPAIPAPEPETGAPETGPVEVRELRKVLLIEDNEDARHALLAVLRHYGYRTFAAADGLEGIAVADEVQPDAAIIDIGLPQYDGYEVARRLRTQTGGNRMLLVALTGYSSREARRQAMEAGFDEYLVKPVSPADLADLIESRLQPEALTG